MVERLVDANRKIAGEPVAASTVPKPVVTPKPVVKKVEKVPIVKTQSSRVNFADLPGMPDAKSVARTRMQRRVHGQLDLPVNPAVASQLSSFLIGDCEDTRTFSDLICLDPVLASKVLQVANSSFYRRSTEVSSVAHALVTVGIKNIQELIAEEAMRTIGETDYFGGFYELARSFWRHSVVVGRITELLKDVMSVNVYEDVYLAGLLHDLGMLSLDVQEPAFYPQLLRPDFMGQNEICDLERQYIGGDHCQAGVYLFEKLGLPKSFLDAAQFHHAPEKAQDHLLMVGLVTLADLFAVQRGICIGASHETTEVAIDESFAWVLIRESHPPFVDVDVNGFIYDFNCELDRSWANIAGDILL
jgi:HD-like signal output (HDOD) protein